MPSIVFKGKEYQNPVVFALAFIGGKWKMPILWRLGQKSPWRYGELKNDINGITHKMLAQQLRELEEDGFITRKVYPVVPPKVEYSITKRGQESLSVIEELRAFGKWLSKDMLNKK